MIKLPFINTPLKFKPQEKSSYKLIFHQQRLLQTFENLLFLFYQIVKSKHKVAMFYTTLHL